MIKKVAIIGQGNVGHYLSRELKKLGVQVDRFSRKAEKKGTIELKNYQAHYDLSILCVPDDHIGELSEQLPTGQGLIAHSSGTAPLEALSEKHGHRAIFYPLMSLTPDSEVAIGNIPFCLECDNSEDWPEYEAWAKELGLNFRYLNSDDRAKIHLAAVISHNFSNQLYHWAWSVLKENDLSMELLKPLLQEQLKAIRKEDPALKQTGPAVRGDRKTIQKHVDQISHSALKDLYLKMSELIATTHEEKL